MPPRASRYAVALALGAAAATTACGSNELFTTQLGTTERLLDAAAVARLAIGDESVDKVTVVGDLDGDGIDDAVIRTRYTFHDPDNVYPELSNIYILYGGPQVTGKLDLTQLPSLTGGNGSNDGPSLAAVGDVDGDGLADVLITASRGAACTGDEAGTDDKHRTGAYLLYGSRTRFTGATPLVNAATFLRDPIPCSYVTDVASLGDLDGDGKADFAVGRGAVAGADAESFVFYGSATRLTGAVDLAATADAVISQAITDPSDLGESTLSAVGDVDGDGFGDFAYRDPAPFGSDVRLIRGSATRLTGRLAPAEISQTVFHGNEQCSSGNVVAFALGDLDGDGADDFVLPTCSLGSFGPGPTTVTQTQHIFYGRAAGFPAEVASTGADATVRLSSAVFATAVLVGRDVDGDGHLDLLVGDAAGHDGNGAVHVMHGDGTRLAGSVDPSAGGKSFVGSPQRGTGCLLMPTDCIIHELAGWDLSAGDLTGDGHPDLLIEAPGDQAAQLAFGTSLGGIYLLSLDGTN